MKINEYPRAAEVTNSDIFVMDTGDGTMGVTAETLKKYAQEGMTGGGDTTPETRIPDAYEIDYDNVDSGLEATDVQAAIDELAEKVGRLPFSIMHKGFSLKDVKGLTGIICSLSDFHVPDYPSTEVTMDNILGFHALMVKEDGGNNGIDYCTSLSPNGDILWHRNASVPETFSPTFRVTIFKENNY